MKARLRSKKRWLIAVAVLATSLVGASALLPRNTTAASADLVTCRTAVDETSTVVSWEHSGVSPVVISRSIDGQPPTWRGRSETSTFTDTTHPDAAYFIQVGGNGDSPIVPCSIPIDTSLTCSVDAGPDSIEVTWTQVDTDRYVIQRSVDGGDSWWRGRTDGDAVSFTDTPRSGVLVYSVAFQFADGSLSVATQCENSGERGTKMDALAFGDMVSCGVPGPELVADLVDTLPGFILGLGDFSQEEGTIEQFENCFDPVMGRHVDRIEPVPGNHEYRTPNAAGYFEYFGAAAGDPTKGYYERTKGNWQILYLNSTCWEVGGCEIDAPQQEWLAEVLAEAPQGQCRIAIMHHPRWSSWGPYASQSGLDPIYTLLHDAGTDLVLTGHGHHYERLTRLDPTGQPDPEGGFRQFTVGTGGTPPRIPDAGDVLADSAVLLTGEWGVLDLDLYEDSYDWRFVTVDNQVLDQGTDTCLG